MLWQKLFPVPPKIKISVILKKQIQCFKVIKDTYPFKVFISKYWVLMRNWHCKQFSWDKSKCSFGTAFWFINHNCGLLQRVLKIIYIKHVTFCLYHYIATNYDSITLELSMIIQLTTKQLKQQNQCYNYS